MIVKLIIVTVVLVAFAVAAIAIKMFMKKGGEFKKQCSSVDADGNRIGCTCGKSSNEACKNN